MAAERLHILVLTDRDWTHPQGGGTGAHLYGQVSRWLAWGHRVSVLACSYPGAAAREEHGSLTLHRVGGRSTVFPRAIWRQWRGLVPDVDVVLEVVNGVTFLTPLWLHKPRVTLVHHIHRGLYAEELGTLGRGAAFLLETAPLALLYRGSRFITISEASASDIAGYGIPREQISVNHMAVEHEAFAPGDRALDPTLLYLGRLKRYKRIELLLDVAEGVPEAKLEIAGEGDHRPELEKEIERRGLDGRVRLLGHVSEEEKVRLYQQAWVNLTASSAEGWSLSVTEAAACATPSVALAVGGLTEAIEHERTGLLADEPEDLVGEVRRVVRDPDLRERLGQGALARAGELTWDATARRTLDALEEERLREGRRHPFVELVEGVASSDTGRAAGLAAAVMTANFIALVFTVVFARLLGSDGYGSLIALLATFVILSVPGNALQITVAREVSRAAAAGDPAPASGVRSWLRHVLYFTVIATAVSIVAREPIAAVIGVDLPWAAAAAIPTGCLWLLLSIERGALQGLQRYRLVGVSVIAEATARLVLGLVLFGVGLDVTGAFLGTTTSIGVTAALLALPLLRATREPHPEGERRLRDLLRDAWAPVLGLAFIVFMWNVDVIVVNHTATEAESSSYAAASVAAKAFVWIAVGLGLYLLPEAARRTRMGLDARPILVRTLVLIASIAVPMLLVYSLAAEPLLDIVFGELTLAAGALPWLGLAMALLACAYLSVQYLLALRRASFLWVLAVAAVAEPLLLLAVGAQLTEVAVALAAVQLALAVAVVSISFVSAAHASARGAHAPA